MRHFKLYALLVFALLLLPGAAALAQAVAPNPEDPNSIIEAIGRAAQSGQWALLAGFVVMLATWAVSKLPGLRDRLPAKALPWLAMGLGVLTNFLISLGSGIKWYQALISGVTQGLLAAGGYSAIGRWMPVVGSKPADPAPPAPPA